MNETEEIADTMATPAPRPAIYVRSATNGEGQLAERLEDARELARMNGLEVTEVDCCIAEYGSGLDSERPGLHRLMQMVEHGEISHLITLQTSHLSRDYHTLYQILVTLAEAGVKVLTTPGTDEPGRHRN